MSNDQHEKLQLGDRVAQSLENPWVVLALLLLFSPLSGFR